MIFLRFCVNLEESFPYVWSALSKVDFASGDGLRDCLVAVGTLDAIVNCAAISQPGSCEKAPALARLKYSAQSLLFEIIFLYIIHQQPYKNCIALCCWLTDSITCSSISTIIFWILSRAINIPSELIKSLTSLSSTCGNPLFIQISTDQVQVVLDIPLK